MLSDRVKRQIDRLLDEVEQAIAQGDWAAVGGQAESVLRLDPENADALAYLAAAQREPGSSGPKLSQTGAPTPSSSNVSAPATADQPTSFANGRYQVKRFLGEGGKKRVYLAHDTLLDREVAFALIKTEGLDDAGRSRVQREAQAMGRLGSHQHIVTVFDLGQEQDQPYMVTELMGGGDVEGLIEDAEGHRLPLEQAIGIAAETCRGLEFAHSRGIVHRDLKPGNIWLTTDGVAKIGDFGLAVALDRSRLTTEGMMVGTVSYMPPEQAMGGEVTPKSDLYSLGAMLYEMVTGRPPFLGDDSVAIIGQHINTPPVAPTWHNDRCPRALDALILRLLAKDPSERPESASDVLSALDAIELVADEVARSRSAGMPLHGEEHSLDSLAGGVFVGRQQEMGALKGCLEDALSGRGRMVTLVGEPGIGKSRTAQELATYAGLRGAQVLWGRCYEQQGAPPYWPWVQAIRSYVREKEPEELRSEMGAGAEDIAEIVSDVRERLPGLSTPPQLEPEQARFRLFDSITAFLRTASQHRPLVLVLDDLHWADHPSLLLLEFVARELSGSRLLLIGTYRDMELSRRHPLSVTLGELTRERLFQRVLLRGLSQQDVGRFIELVSGVAPPRGMVEAVHRQTEGNPLFVTEVVRLLVQEGELTQDAGRTEGRDSWSIRIPEGVRQVIGRRLDRLSERCNETLTIASIVGREFTLDQISPLIDDISGDRLLEVLEEALASRVIEELPHSVGRYQFTHALIQETLAGELSTTRKVRLHARIAESLEEDFGEEAEDHAAELAFHFAEAQTVLGTDRLVRYSLLAGERAIAAFAWEEAQAHYQRGLTSKGVELNGPDSAADAEAAALLFGQGRAMLSTAQREEFHVAVDSLRRAFDYFSDAGEVEKAVSVAEYPYDSQSGFDTGISNLITRALSLVPPDSHAAGRLLFRYGYVLGLEAGDYPGAQRAVEAALAIAEREGDLGLEMRILADAARVDRYNLRFDEWLKKSRRALELAVRFDDLRVQVIAEGDVTLALYCKGDLDGAQQHGAAMSDASERLRSRNTQLFSHHYNMILHHSMGDWQAARNFGERGLAVSRQYPGFLDRFAALEHELGNTDQGDQYLGELLEATASTGTSFAAAIAPYVARINGDVGRIQIAQKTVDAVPSLSIVAPVNALIVRVGLALMAVIRQDAKAAAELYEYLEPGHPGMPVQGTICFGRLLGLLSQTMGNLDQGAAHFEEALMFSRAGYRVELAWSCCEYADLLRERDGPGDKEKAIPLLDESLAISSELGMRPLMERVLSRREILGA
ncbi:MAG: protein kinase [Chloroflexi bacterium]|nr:protein kinase [Chloroflexota bacterium]